MKKITVLFIILLCALFLVGCNKGITNSATASSSKAICGNNLVEKGETSANCCVDVSCDQGFECESKMEAGTTVYFCKKLDKKESYEYKKFKEYMEDIDSEYEKPEPSLINWGTMLSKTESMAGFLAKLKEQGYDVAVDEEFLKHYKRRINLNKIIYEKAEDADSLSEEKQIEIIDEYLQLYETEIQDLSAIDENMKIGLDKEYEYDVQDKIVSTNEMITEFKKQKELLEKGTSATIDVTNFDSTCYSGDYGYLTSVNLGIKNEGGLAIEDPVVDVYLMSGTTSIIDKETDMYFGYADLQPDEERFEQESFMLGYLSGESVPCKKYDLKINLRSGANPKIIATTTVKVEIK